MNDFFSYGIVAAIGALVGIAELISRYRDEPVKALFSGAGLTYITVNLIASTSALYVIDSFNWRFAVDESTPAEALRIIQVFTAGFGAVALFRSALFSVRIGESDVNVGPSAFLQILLNSCDRAVDRSRASSRAEQVVKTLSGLQFNDVKTALPALCFGLMQNLDTEQQRIAGTEIRNLINDNTISDEVKLMNLGLTLMNIVGENVLQAAVDAHKKVSHA